MATLAEVKQLIDDKAAAVRDLKASKAAPEAIKAEVEALLAAKEQFKSLNNGVPFDPPKAAPEKKEKAAKPAAAAVPAVDTTGLSKVDAAKALAKAQREAAKKNKKDKADKAVDTQAIQVAAALPGQAPEDTVIFTSSALPGISTAVCSLTGFKLHFALTAGDSLPCLTLAGGESITGDHAIARYIARTAGKHELLGSSDNSPTLTAQVDQWLDACLTHSPQQLSAALEPYLASRTYLVGYALTLADVAVFNKLQGGRGTGEIPDQPQHVTRWVSLISALPEVTTALRLIKALKGVSGRPAPDLARKAAEAKKKAADAKASDKKDDRIVHAVFGEGGILPELEGAEEGKVLTRFPPEPSGYLHIGHVKACVLNEYYARRYKGKMLVRFDDTNPSKEKGEYEDAIMTDLATLGVKADLASHTSDFFPEIKALAEQAIAEGWAFMDDTPQEQMQSERMERKESARREQSIEENKRLFALMCAGDASASNWCLRAKIDMASMNGTLRDPVIYRMNLTPHHKTGTRYKAYPTYDFACPVVDSIEGVTHALRTTEYQDRDEQYYWIQKKLRIRPVVIQSFARMNFIRTVLSKRKLDWFVKQGLVDGWFDPRFPTVQGVMRRGVSVDALRAFILSQGASKKVVNMEWEKFWSTNKAQYEPTAPRYMGVFKEGAVVLTLTDVAAVPAGGVSAISVPLHPKDPTRGQRPMRIGPEILLEHSDAQETTEGEDVTLMRWGVVSITGVHKNAAGIVTALTGITKPEGDFKKTRKINWLAVSDDLVPATLVEFDYLITKEKLEEGDELQDYLTPKTRAESACVVDPCMRHMRVGEIVQLERRGFVRCDVEYGKTGPDSPLVLFLIPDGKGQAMSTLTKALNHV